MFFVKYLILLAAASRHISCTNNVISGFDDTILYSIQWPGNKSDVVAQNDDREFMVVTSSHQEKYKCYLPRIDSRETASQDKYDGPTPLELISPLFSQTSCSYRLESYWTYEVCHGRFIRQFHEDREGKKVKLQEYYLGRWSDEQLNTMAADLKTERDSNNGGKHPPTKKIDGMNLPFFEITMGNGTLCDLNQNRPRQTRIIYVCYAHGKHEIFSLKETSTCQYEIVILSPFLCTHPKYKSIGVGDNPVECVPFEGSPTKPHNLIKMAAESAKLRRRPDQIRVEFVQVPSSVDDRDDEDTSPAVSPRPISTPPTDVSPVEAFLSGRNCLTGGTGWWNYKFCYGKYVEQFHEARDGSRTSINLGNFNLLKHLSWIKKNPHKLPKPFYPRVRLSHFYTDGSICDKTGKPRQTEVKLKCLEGASSPSALVMYLLEPRYCEYILGVESPLICEILHRADDNGLILPLNADDADDIDIEGSEDPLTATSDALIDDQL